MERIDRPDPIPDAPREELSHSALPGCRVAIYDNMGQTYYVWALDPTQPEESYILGEGETPNLRWEVREWLLAHDLPSEALATEALSYQLVQVADLMPGEDSSAIAIVEERYYYGPRIQWSTVRDDEGRPLIYSSLHAALACRDQLETCRGYRLQHNEAGRPHYYLVDLDKIHQVI